MNREKPEKPTPDEIAQAVCTMARVVPFFPQDEPAKEIIIAILRDFIGSRQGLDWLSNTAVRVIENWRGPAQLRALYCTRYRPCDNLPATACDIPGFTPTEAMDAAKMDYLERESREFDLKLAGCKREYKLLGQTPSVMQFPALKEMPEARRSMEPEALRVDAVIASYQGTKPPDEPVKEITHKELKRAEAELREKRPEAWKKFDDSAAIAAEPWFQELQRGRT